ncbi:TPA: hypothetical protein DEB72_00545 [Patescibacteria group bacterium]|nr:hypothetical protein [Patescibacteria group bacterium]
MIKKITQEIDKIIKEKNENPRLRELVLKVMMNHKDFPKKLVNMCNDIHDEDSFTSEDEEAKEDGMRTFAEFAERLQKIKQENIEFWDQAEQKTATKPE